MNLSVLCDELDQLTMNSTLSISTLTPLQLNSEVQSSLAALDVIHQPREMSNTSPSVQTPTGCKLDMNLSVLCDELDQLTMNSTLSISTLTPLQLNSEVQSSLAALDVIHQPREMSNTSP